VLDHAVWIILHSGASFSHPATTACTTSISFAQFLPIIPSIFNKNVKINFSNRLQVKKII
jgi:hypothetical protein